MFSFDWDLKSGAVEHSPNHAHLLGTTIADAAAGWSIVHPDDVARVRAVVDDAIARRGSYVVEHRALRQDSGEVLWLEVRGQVVCGDDGEPARVVGIAVDVSERSRAEAALRHRAAQFQTLIDSAPLGVYLVDADLRIAQVNPVARPVFGDIPGGLLGRDFDAVTHLLWEPQYADEVVQLFRRTLASGESYVAPERAEYRIDRNTVEYYEWRLDRIVLPDGRFGLVCYFRDISQQVQARQRIERSEQRFRAMADSTPAIVWSADAHGNISYHNPRWLAYTGLSAEENSDWALRVLHPDDRERCNAAWQQALDSGSEYEVEVRNRRHDGEYRWFLTRAVPVRDAQGRIVEWTGSSTDIHDLKLADQALRDADRRKDEFLAMLAHELRNPLAPIRNSVHLMSLAGDPARNAPIREMLERQVNHMVRLVDDLMEVSRISSGKIELKRERVELAEVLNAAIESSRPALERGAHRFTFAAAHEPLPLHGDPVRLAQVFSNLLNNAARYTDDGGRIELSARRDGDAALVSVRDSGIGIAREQLPQLFRMFSQLDRSHARVHGGLGIGLSLVQRLVQMHGGSVQAASDGLGHGSRFTVRLPLAGGEAAAPDDSPQFGSGAPALQRVLVVDDNRDAADSLALVLDMLGAEARVAHAGAAALALADEWRPEVVLLDLGMPGMDGYEVARRLRAEPRHVDLTLVALTGWGQQSDRERTRDAGFDHHLVKPVEIEALRLLLDAVSAARRR